MWHTVLRRVTGVQPVLSVTTSSQWWCADRWQPLKESILGAVEMAQQLSALVLLQRTRVWFQILTWWLTATCTFNSWALNAFCCSQQALFTIVAIHTWRYIYTHKIMSKSKCLYFGLSFWRFQTIMIIPITYELWQGKHIMVEDGLRVKGFLYEQRTWVQILSIPSKFGCAPPIMLAWVEDLGHMEISDLQVQWESLPQKQDEKQ